MKPAGAIYKSKDKNFLAVYRFNRDIHVKLPEGLAEERVAHMAYSMGKKQGGIDIFPITDQERASQKINLKKIITLNDKNTTINDFDKKSNTNISLNDLENIIKIQDVEGEISNFANFKEIRFLALSDIKYYCKEKEAETKNSQIILSVDSLSANTKLETINKSSWLSGGKSEFVKACQLEANIDFVDDCWARFLPEENASFDGITFKNYFHLVGGDCEYCYAASKHKSFPKTIFNFDAKKILDELKGNCNLIYGNEEVLGRPVKVLRFGKRTESWTPITENSFVKTLELMTQTKTRGIIPTKFLPFDKEISNLVKKTDSTLLYSLGDDDWESGAVAHGATNQFRIKQAIKYKKDGANAMFYLLLPTPYLPPSEKEIKILEIANKHKIQVQVLPMRHGTKDFACKATCQNWEILKDNNLRLNLFGDADMGSGAYKYQQGIGLLPIQYHESWKKIIGKNKGKIKMCHHDDKNVYCGTCSYKPGFIVPLK